jgi:hypothetical protein
MRAKEARTTAKAKPGSIPIKIFDMRNIIFLPPVLIARVDRA